MIPYLLATRGVLHPAGGFSGLAGRLLDLAAMRGAAFRAGETVRESSCAVGASGPSGSRPANV